MKAVILAGGLGTRISEESHLKPKPMIEIGGKPILWHIMKLYSHYGINDFVICAGYKQHVIKEFFADYYLHCSDITFDFSKGGEMTVNNNVSEPWKVTIVDTGLHTMTGGRIKRLKSYLDDTFMLTYGDGVSDVDIDKLLEFHRSHGKMVTLTAVHPEGRYGMMDMDNNIVKAFREKDVEDVGWVNGGFMVLEPEVLDLIEGDETVFEKDTLKQLTKKKTLAAFRHDGFWYCMDTLRDKEKLEAMWESGNAQWKVW